MPENSMRAEGFTPTLPIAEGLPQDLSEVAIWMQAVRYCLDARTAENAQINANFRQERGMIGVLARLTLPVTPPAPDAERVAYAVQSVQIALLNPNDNSGISAALPNMAVRAREHGYASRFQERTRGTERYHTAARGVPSAALALLRIADARLTACGVPPNSLVGVVERRKPTPLSRAIARLAMGATRDLLFHTVFEPHSPTRPT